MPRPKSFVRHFFGLLGWLAAGATALALIMGMIGQSGFRNAQRLEVEGAEAPALVTDKRISRLVPRSMPISVLIAATKPAMSRSSISWFIDSTFATVVPPSGAQPSARARLGTIDRRPATRMAFMVDSLVERSCLIRRMARTGRHLQIGSSAQ